MSSRAPIGMIKPNPWNINLLTDEEFNRLKELMRASGPERTPPVVVRERDGYYEIIDGEQRWRAARDLGWQEVPIMVIDASDLEAKKYTLSFNYLKGRINYVKMLELMVEDEELAAAAKEVFSRGEWSTIEKMLNLYREGRLSPFVLRVIEAELRKGTRIDPRILEILDVPEVHQDAALGMMLTAYSPKELRELLLRQHEPEEVEGKEEHKIEEKALREEGSGAAPTFVEEKRLEKTSFESGVERAEEVKKEVGRREPAGKVAEEGVKKAETEKAAGEEPVEKTVRDIVVPAEAVVSFTCEKCKAQHAICWNREHKTIEVYRIEGIPRGESVIKSLRTCTFKVPFTTFACPRCGKMLGVDFQDRRVLNLAENREG